MSLFSSRYTKEGPGIDKNAPKKKGLALFFEILGREFWELIKLNLIFILYCIPVVTIGPAIGAMTSVTITMVRDKPSDVFYDFRKAFKANFKNSLICGLIGIVVIAVLITSSFFYIQNVASNLIYSIPLFLIGTLSVLFSISWIYVFPMVTTIEIPLKTVFKNAFLLGIACLAHSFPAVIVWLLLSAFFILFFPYTFPLFIFFSFSLLSFITSFAAWAGIQKYVTKE